MPDGAVLIRGARQLLTLQGPPGPRRGPEMSSLSIIEDGSVLLREGRILRVGRTRQVENLAEARTAVEFDATGRIVLPPFIDSLADVGPCGGKQADNAARRMLRLSVRHGTSTVGARSLPAGDEAATHRSLRRLSALGQEAGADTVVMLGPMHGALPAYAQRLREKRAIGFACAICGSGGLDPQRTLEFVGSCFRCGVPAKVQVAEHENNGCIEHLLAAGVFALEGLNLITPAEAELTGQSRVMAVLAPGTVLSGRAGHYPPGRTLIEAGAAVALASGFLEGAMATLSMQTVIGLAMVRMRMSLQEALCAATFNAAHALGIAESTGSLEHGKSADLLIADVPDYRELGSLFGVNVISCMIKKGRLAYKESDSRWPAI